MTDLIVVPPTDSDNLKRCSRCHEWKTRDEFYVRRRSRDGLRAECKECNYQYRVAKFGEIVRRDGNSRPNSREAKAERNRRYYAANKAKLNEQSRRYREENREAIAQAGRLYREKNREIIAEYKRQHYASTREITAESNRKWRELNPDKVRAYHHNRRARKSGNGGTHSAADLAAIRAAQTDKLGRLICWACGKPIKSNPHLDHWLPLYKQGPNSAGNLHYMHAKCNQLKHRKHPFELGRLL